MTTSKTVGLWKQTSPIKKVHMMRHPGMTQVSPPNKLAIEPHVKTASEKYAELGKTIMDIANHPATGDIVDHSVNYYRDSLGPAIKAVGVRNLAWAAKETAKDTIRKHLRRAKVLVRRISRKSF